MGQRVPHAPRKRSKPNPQTNPTCSLPFSFPRIGGLKCCVGAPGPAFHLLSTRTRNPNPNRPKPPISKSKPEKQQSGIPELKPYLSSPPGPTDSAPAAALPRRGPPPTGKALQVRTAAPRVDRLHGFGPLQHRHSSQTWPFASSVCRATRHPCWSPSIRPVAFTFDISRASTPPHIPVLKTHSVPSQLPWHMNPTSRARLLSAPLLKV